MEQRRIEGRKQAQGGSGKNGEARQPSKPLKSSKVSKVSHGNHAKVSETIESETFGEEAIEGGEPERRSIGRPTLFRDEYVEQAYKLCLLGATDAELLTSSRYASEPSTPGRRITRNFCSPEGWCLWMLPWPRACTSAPFGYSHPDVHISNFQGMITVTDIVKHYPPDTGAAFIWLKNRQPHKWKDKVEVKEDINLNIFPPKEVLKELFEASLKLLTENAAIKHQPGASAWVS